MQLDPHPAASLQQIAHTMSSRAPVSATAMLSRSPMTNPYAAGDVFVSGTAPSPPLKFSGILGSPGGSVLLLRATLIDLNAGSSVLNGDLYLFSAPLGIQTDTSPLLVTALEMETFVELISFSTLTRKVGSSNMHRVLPNTTLFGKPDSADLYGYLVANAAFTPPSGGKFLITLGVMPQDVSLF